LGYDREVVEKYLRKTCICPFSYRRNSGVIQNPGKPEHSMPGNAILPAV
jgi:hypothetical protein